MVKEYCGYNGEHSALIGNKDTFVDWHLVPTGGDFFCSAISFNVFPQ